MCLPKEEGGLGIMKSKSWNKATMIKHIWKIQTMVTFFGLINYKLKNKSFWEIWKNGDNSWVWRKLLKIKEKIKLKFKKIINNGYNTHIWHGN